MNIKRERLHIVIAGLIIGVIASLLVFFGNPANMGFCIACFLRDTAGGLGLHRAAAVQYIRPEIIGLVLGSFGIALFKGEFSAQGGSAPLARDLCPDILSRPVDVSKFGLIFAGAQKNLAPAGLTIVIIREDLAGSELPITPAIMNYKSMIAKDSMNNTPPCWCIYMLGLMCDWLEQQGGAAGMEKINVKKAQMLYDVLDASKLFTVSAEKGSRSFMNVTFRSPSDEMDAKFVAESVKAGFTNLKGHRSVGGMRASIYNAMPMEGVEKLCEVIQKFEKEN